jgi:hypothetical protein
MKYIYYQAQHIQANKYMNQSNDSENARGC